MRKNRIIQIFAIFFSLILLASCEYDFIEVYTPPPPNPNDTISFAQEVAPIFESSECTGCHNGGLAFDLTAANAYNSIINNSLVVPFNPDESIIYTFPNPVSGTHHTRYNSNSEATLLRNWILQGALNN